MENTNIPPTGASSPMDTPFYGQRPLPNATAVLVLGIISIPVCFCYITFGVVGIVLGVIALVLSNKDLKAHKENPTAWTPQSLSNLRAGRVCAIIGLSVNALLFLVMVIYIIWVIMVFGTLAQFFSQLPWDQMGR